MHREGVDIDHGGLEFGLSGHTRHAVDVLLLGRHEQHVHLAALGPLAQHLVVDLDVLDVVGDLLLGLPVDLLVELGVGHHRERHLLDDDGVPGDRQRHLAALDLVLVEELVEPLDDGRGVLHVAVDDRLRRQRVVAELHQGLLAPDVLELAELDGARPDVDPHQVVSVSHAGLRVRSWGT